MSLPKNFGLRKNKDEKRDSYWKNYWGDYNGKFWVMIFFVGISACIILAYIGIEYYEPDYIAEHPAFAKLNCEEMWEYILHSPDSHNHNMYIYSEMC